MDLGDSAPVYPGEKSAPSKRNQLVRKIEPPKPASTRGDERAEPPSAPGEDSERAIKAPSA